MIQNHQLNRRVATLSQELADVKKKRHEDLQNMNKEAEGLASYARELEVKRSALQRRCADLERDVANLKSVNTVVATEKSLLISRVAITQKEIDIAHEHNKVLSQYCTSLETRLGEHTTMAATFFVPPPSSGRAGDGGSGPGSSMGEDGARPSEAGGGEGRGAVDPVPGSVPPRRRSRIDSSEREIKKRATILTRDSSLPLPPTGDGKLPSGARKSPSRNRIRYADDTEFNDDTFDLLKSSAPFNSTLTMADQAALEFSGNVVLDDRVIVEEVDDKTLRHIVEPILIPPSHVVGDGMIHNILSPKSPSCNPETIYDSTNVPLQNEVRKRLRRLSTHTVNKLDVKRQNFEKALLEENEALKKRIEEQTRLVSDLQKLVLDHDDDTVNDSVGEANSNDGYDDDEELTGISERIGEFSDTVDDEVSLTTDQIQLRMLEQSRLLEKIETSSLDGVGRVDREEEEESAVASRNRFSSVYDENVIEFNDDSLLFE